MFSSHRDSLCLSLLGHWPRSISDTRLLNAIRNSDDLKAAFCPWGADLFLIHAYS